MYNRVILIGRISTDINFTKVGDNQTPKATFRLAVDRRDKDNNTDFFNIVVWNKLAEVINNNLGKGRLINVEGKLRNRSYEKDGQTFYITEIIVDSVTFLDSAKKVTNDDGPDTPVDNDNAPDDNNETSDEGVPF